MQSDSSFSIVLLILIFSLYLFKYSSLFLLCFSQFLDSRFLKTIPQASPSLLIYSHLVSGYPEANILSLFSFIKSLSLIILFALSSLYFIHSSNSIFFTFVIYLLYFALSLPQSIFPSL